jgi:hypothetical protein
MQPRSDAACSSVPLECNVRQEGWYFVRFENWDGGHDDWCPAWWNGMYWGSYRYSGIPDSRAIVGDKIVMPNALGNRRAAFGASVLTDGLAGKRTE